MNTLKKNGTRVHLVDVVKGLNSDVEMILDRVNNLDFDVGCLAISDDELKGLRTMVEGDKEINVEPNAPERIYAENLSKFGEVSLPPPSYVAFVKYCIEYKIKVIAVDMDEEHYTMAYCDHVSGTQWMLQSLREKRIKRKNFKNKTARDFAIEWDRTINKLKGYQELEKHRENVIAKNLVRVSKKGDSLVLLEVERLDGVTEQMQDMGWELVKQ
ncbi:MAG: hypothetical protein ACOCTK_00070 [Candidatus Saliniplasma sp.]